MKNEVERPRYTPKRYDWWPGEDLNRLGFRIREAELADRYTIRSVLKINDRQVLKWMNYYGYSIWLLTRNYRNLSACIAARFLGPTTEVLRYWYDWPSYQAAWGKGFATLIQCEVPERPMEWVVKLEHDKLIRDLVDACFIRSGADDEAGTVVLTRKPLVGTVK